MDIDNKIINGENAGLNEFPWMALLQYKTGKTNWISENTL